MIYRPNRWRIARTAVLLIGLGMVAALWSGQALVVRLAGLALVLVASPALFAKSRASIRIGEGLVEINGVRGAQSFVAGKASVSLVVVAGGPLRQVTALRFEARDGRVATVSLAFFDSEDRSEVHRAVEAVLK